MKLDRDTADAILKLRPYPAFQKFLEAIRQDGIQAMLDLVAARGESVGRLQGRAEYANEVCDAVGQAADVLAKFENKPTIGEDGYARSTRISPTLDGTRQPASGQSQGWNAHS
jgi:hypothetical protein